MFEVAFGIALDTHAGSMTIGGSASRYLGRRLIDFEDSLFPCNAVVNADCFLKFWTFLSQLNWGFSYG